MVAEIVAWTFFDSMALLADGWLMGTHVAAFLITIYAYRYARRNAENPAYAFGTGKVGMLGGFATAITLAVVALVVLVESLHRIIRAFLLKDNHHHESDDHHRWSYGLLKQTGPILLDAGIVESDRMAVSRAIENDSDNRISDLHIWRISASHYAALISLVTHDPKPVDHYKHLLIDFPKLAHITIEVLEWNGELCFPVATNAIFDNFNTVFDEFAKLRDKI